MTETTELAIHYSDGINMTIIRLGGQYPGCRPGVRLVEGDSEPLPWLSRNAMYDILVGEREYAITWGSGTTILITAAEREQLIAANARAFADHEERVHTQDAQSDADDARLAAMPRHARPCPYCHTYCDGDCRAR
jgi:hypothetical protein